MNTAITEGRPDAAVIIPHYNDVTRLGRCLDALLRNDTTDAEIVVVDNGSTQPLDDLRARFPAVRFLVEAEKGAAAARNRGVRETTAPLLCFIDADCVPDHDWLSVAREVADRADLVGGRVDVFDETPPPRSGAEAFEAIFAFNFRRYIEVQGFSGAGNLVTRRDVFDAIGGFVNGVSEDREWTMRAVARGYSLVYEDRLRVTHPSRQDWPALRVKWQRMTREGFQLNGTSPGRRLRWGLRGLAMPASAVAHTPKVLLSGKLDTPGEYLRAVATLVRLRCLRMVWMLRQSLGLPI
ncbi:glycosyltransferase [Maritimibacter sp. 55A14]|uniref:glycosyltransferase family 2 protein n=1 Tax=Maritimibacter sp. 55A14 TaxID=2174844 RepID=UPI000D61DE30|nr:glycosyltransferase [Maritimibacter sp. 55A14]PWE32981.1 glycosyltransferase [Maritimibacter sp. 55A14]